MEHPQPYSGGGASRKFEYGEPDGDKHVVATPIWLIAPRAIQFIFAIAVLALCASDSDINAKVSKFGIAVSVFTWVISPYAILTEKIDLLRIGYHIFAVIALDVFLLIMWFAEAILAFAARPDYTIQGGFIVEAHKAHAPVGALALLECIISVSLVVGIILLARHQEAFPSNIHLNDMFSSNHEAGRASSQPYAAGSAPASAAFVYPTEHGTGTHKSGGFMGKIKDMFSMPEEATAPPPASSQTYVPPTVTGGTQVYMHSGAQSPTQSYAPPGSGRQSPPPQPWQGYSGSGGV